MYYLAVSMGLEAETFGLSVQGLKADVKVRPDAFSSRGLRRERFISRVPQVIGGVHFYGCMIEVPIFLPGVSWRGSSC